MTPRCRYCGLPAVTTVEGVPVCSVHESVAIKDAEAQEGLRAPPARLRAGGRIRDPDRTRVASAASTNKQRNGGSKVAGTEMFKRPANGADNSDKPRKDDLVGSLLVLTMGEYDSDCETKYGTQSMAEFDLVVVDGDYAGYSESARREFGNLAMQIGVGLQPGDRGVGRYISGEGNQGRRWFGMEWSEDDADYAAAKAALKSASA